LAPNLAVGVADTSPLNYLILIEADQILPRLFHKIAIAPSILEELSHRNTPTLVSKWIANRPAWLEVAKPKSIPEQAVLALHLGKEMRFLSLLKYLQCC
jgi:hypothetical protein